MINSAEPKIHDVDRDGCADLVMWNSAQETSTEAPLVYRNTGSGQFEAMLPEPFTGPAGAISDSMPSPLTWMAMR